MRIRVYYEDTDCGGIVYHTNYIKYCERARSELFFAQGTPPSHATCGFVVSALEAKFLGFAKLGDILEVRTKVLKIGKVQLVLEHKIFVIYQLNKQATLLESSNNTNQDSSAQEVCVFEAQARLGYVDVISQKPIIIPDDFRTLLQKLH